MMKGQPEDGVADAIKGGAGEPEVDIEAKAVVQMDVETDVKNDQTVTVQTRAQAGAFEWESVVSVIVNVLIVGALLCLGLFFLYISHELATSDSPGNDDIIGERIATGLGTLGVFLFGVGLIMGAGVAPVLVAVVLLCTCAFGTWEDVEKVWQRMVELDGDAPVPFILAAPFVIAALLCMILSVLMHPVTAICLLIYYTGSGICFATGYFAKEALGKGGEHVKGMYAVYALLSLGSVLGELLLVCTVVGLAFAMASGYDCEAPSRGDLPDTIGKKVAYKLLNVLCVRLLCSTAMVFLVAGVVWAGTGICVAIGYFAAHAQGRGEGSFTGVYSLLTIGAVLGGLLYAWVVAGLMVAGLSQCIYGDGRTRSEQPDSAANKAVDRDAVKSFFLRVRALLFFATAGAFLAAGVGWVGTEIYLLCSALVQ
uniref:Uncharacterized protein n=1 Tax=Prasinoderma coloniale TaxID=156133 RepID=A0A7R9TAD8_9VIRI|mmetsp:Transcript_11435/g.47913  ORF Transcript_11435/g.47913 Transcript_11435/m.47913 type:complete len:425 (+) Transcript_11435:128-1402(+)